MYSQAPAKVPFEVLGIETLTFYNKCRIILYNVAERAKGRRIDMSLTMIKILLLVACFGHVLCCFCDRAITYTPNGRFHFGDLNDNAKLSALFNGAPLKN